MDVQLTPDLQSKLEQLAQTTGRPPNDVVLDAMTGYFHDLEHTRQTLDTRYDDLKAGKVQTIDGYTFFEDLRRREEALLARQSPQ